MFAIASSRCAPKASADGSLKSAGVPPDGAGEGVAGALEATFEAGAGAAGAFGVCEETVAGVDGAAEVDEDDGAALG